MVDDAQAARPHKIDGRIVLTRRVVPRENAAGPEALSMVNTLYVRGINEDYAEEDLRDYFALYGNIVSVNVVIDKKTGYKRGFAFVEFDDYDPVDKIVLQHHYFKGRKLEVQKALSREKSYLFQLKKNMGDLGRGRGAWSETYNLQRGGYVGGYGGDFGYSGFCGGYGSGRGAGWGSSFEFSYGRGPIRGNTGYAQHIQLRGRGTGGYGYQ